MPKCSWEVLVSVAKDCGFCRIEDYRSICYSEVVDRYEIWGSVGSNDSRDVEGYS